MIPLPLLIASAALALVAIVKLWRVCTQHDRDAAVMEASAT